MNVRIGTAPDSWGVWFPSDPRQTPPTRFLDEAKEAGYEWIELGPVGYLPTDGSMLKRELDARELKVTATGSMVHIEEPEGFRKMEEQADLIGPLLQELGAPYFLLIDDTYTDIFTGNPTRETKLDSSQWNRLVSGANHVGRLVAERYGLQLVFHPHAETHVEYEDQIEAFLDQTDPKYVNLCLDTGHHAYRGGDPIGFFRKHFSRIPYLHLKSVDGQIQRKVNDEKIPLAKAVEMGMFTEPSVGMVDFVAFKNALEEVNYQGWGIVEQDMYPVEFDKPLPIARRSLQYLKEIGIG